MTTWFNVINHFIHIIKLNIFLKMMAASQLTKATSGIQLFS